jgi:hypothetical protein
MQMVMLRIIYLQCLRFLHIVLGDSALTLGAGNTLIVGANKLTIGALPHANTEYVITLRF